MTNHIDGHHYDQTLPTGKWLFDSKVSDVFENMLSRSIPQYETMRDVVFSCGRNFVSSSSTVIDCGASQGGAIAPFVSMSQPPRRFICVEPSAPMAASLRSRFPADGPVIDVIEEDIRNVYPDEPADLALSVLTLQFVPIEHRQGVIQKIHDNLSPGGALILVEKVLGSDSRVNELLVEEYRAYKTAQGYSREQIDRKALSLEGVLVPVTAEWNIGFLKQSGFAHVDCIWRWMNFAAWVAIK
jgi:tRNA (cmo5U34)-methyltransferase